MALDTLTLLELGRASLDSAPAEQWEGVGLLLTDTTYASDRVMRIVSLALGQPMLGRAIVLEQVAHDLGDLVPDTPAAETTHATRASALAHTVALLRQSIFAGLDEPYLQILAGKLTSETFIAGDVIFRQRSDGDALYIIASGRAQVVIETRDGYELEVERPGPGKFFGEFALLDGQRRAATVRAIEPTRTLCLPRVLFDAVCADHPEMYRSVAAELARKLRTTNIYVEFFHDYSPSERLLMGMRYLMPAHGPASGDILSYDLAAIREALTRVPGNTPEIVDHDLARLSELGVLTLAPRRAQLNLRTLMHQLVASA